MSNNLKQKGTTALLWDITGKFANSGVGFLVAIVLTRILEPNEFGLIAIVLVVLGIISVFFDIGLAAALIQRRKVLPIHYSSVFYFNILAATFLTCLVFTSAPWIANFYDNFVLVKLIEVMSFSFLIGAFGSIQKVQLQKKLNYALLTKITISSSIFSGVFGITLALYGAGVWSLVIQNLSLGIVNSVLLWMFSSWRPSWSFSFKALRNLWRFGFHIFLVSIMNAVFGRIDMMVAGKLVFPTTLGYYDRAKALNQMIYSYIAGSLMSVLFPVLSKVQNDLERFKNIVIKIYAILTFFIFFTIGIFYLNAEELITILYSVKWLPSVEYFKIVVLSTFSYIYGAFLINIIISRGKSKLFLRIDIYKKILFAINLYVGFSFGLIFFLWGNVIVSILSFLIDIRYATREIKLVSSSFLLGALIQSIIGIVSVYTVYEVTKSIEYNSFVMLLIKSIVFVILYCTISWILKTDAWHYVTEELKSTIKKRKNKK